MPELLDELLDGVSVAEFERVPFESAIAWLREKVPLPTEVWDELWAEFQDYAFAIAGVTRAEVLEDIQGAIAKAMEAGTSFQQFKKDFQQVVERRGWTEGKGYSAYRVEMLLSQNLRTAYAAGRWQQMQDPVVQQNRPWGLYRHRDSRHPRPHHLALDGKVFPLSDPIWRVIMPPNGFGCRCQMFSLSDRDLAAMGLHPSEPIAETVTLRDRVTGATQQVPAVRVNGELKPIAEPGFTSAPGSRQLGDEWIESAIGRLSPALQAQVRKELL